MPAAERGLVRLQGLEAIRAFVHEHVLAARQRLWILSPDLNPFIYDDPGLADAISALVRRSRYTDVRMLIQGSRSLPANGHRLVSLAGRLSSRIQLRRHATDEPPLVEALLLVDSGVCLHQPRATDPVALADAHAPPRVQTLENRFRTYWMHAAPDAELRRLGI